MSAENLSAQPVTSNKSCECYLDSHRARSKYVTVIFSEKFWDEILGAAGEIGMTVKSWLEWYAFRKLPLLPFGRAANGLTYREPVKLSDWCIRFRRDGRVQVCLPLEEAQWARIRQAANRSGMQPSDWLEQHGLAGLIPPDLTVFAGGLSCLN